MVRLRKDGRPARKKTLKARTLMIGVELESAVSRTQIAKGLREKLSLYGAVKQILFNTIDLTRK